MLYSVGLSPVFWSKDSGGAVEVFPASFLALHTRPHRRWKTLIATVVLWGGASECWSWGEFSGKFWGMASICSESMGYKRQGNSFIQQASIVWLLWAWHHSYSWDSSMNKINLFLHRSCEGDRKGAMHVISKWCWKVFLKKSLLLYLLGIR